MISREMPATIVATGGHKVKLGITATLNYDIDIDPFAVQMVFSSPGEDDVVWHFSRELLYQGVNSYARIGRGDVKLQYMGLVRGVLVVCLSNSGGHADIELPHRDVITFLGETIDAVAVGEEECEYLIDEALEEILNG